MPQWECDSCDTYQLNVFTAHVCTQCGSKNYCMLDEPPAMLLSQAKQDWLKIDDFGRVGVNAGTPGYLQPKHVLTLLNAIPQSTRSQCVLIDLGCGPGHVLCVAQYCGFHSLAGIDTADGQGIFDSNWGKCSKGQHRVYTQFQRDCTEA